MPNTKPSPATKRAPERRDGARGETTAEIDEAQVRAQVGRRVRQARERAGLTGRKLAELADVTPGFISQIERGQVVPSVMTLVRVVHALGIKMADLFDAKHPPTGEVIDERDWAVFQYPDGSFEDAVLAIDPEGSFEVVWSRLEPGYGSGYNEHAGVASRMHFVFVLSGELELHVGEERHVLRERSCICFPSAIPHVWTNASTKRTEMLSVITPAAY